MKEQENLIYWIILLISISFIVIFSIGFSIEYSQIWVYEHIGIDSYNFVGNLHNTGDVNYQNLNYTVDRAAHFTAIEKLEEKIQTHEKPLTFSLTLIIIGYLIILGPTIYTVIKNTTVKDDYDKDYENNFMSVVGVFFSICFGLSSGSYLLLISLRKDYLFQLLTLITQNIPYEKLPIIDWDPSYQILCISYIGFEIISILLFSSLLLQIGYSKSNRREFKRGSNAYFIAAILLSIGIFYIFSHLDNFY